MVLPLDFLLLVAISVLTFTLLLVNYVAYLGRRRRYVGVYSAGALLLGGSAIAIVLSPILFGLGEQYGTGELLSRWGFSIGWAFMLTLSGACAAVYERNSGSRLSVTLSVVATLLLGFALVGGLLFSSGALPPFPTSIVNLGLAALFTSLLRLLFERRRDREREKVIVKKGFRERLADLIRG
jgi:hypothetical protein